MILFNHFLNCFFGCFDLGFCGRCGRIYNRCIEHFTGLVNNCQLTAGAECRIPSENNFSHDWRLHQQLFQVLSEHFNRTVFGFLCQIVSNLPLDGRCDQTFIAVLHNCFQNRGGIRIVGADHLTF